LYYIIIIIEQINKELSRRRTVCILLRALFLSIMLKFIVLSFGLISLMGFTTFSPDITQASSGGCMWSDRNMGCDPTFSDGHCALDEGCTPV